MVSLRCILKVEEELKNLDIEYSDVKLGVVRLGKQLGEAKINLLKDRLCLSGLEIIDGEKDVMAERVKTCVVEFWDLSKEIPKVNFPDYLRENLNQSYPYIANVFSERIGVSITRYLLVFKIEKAKELISYGDLNFSEIAYRLHFSSISHFSRTFKNIAGYTPSEFKNRKGKNRFYLESIGQIENTSQMS